VYEKTTGGWRCLVDFPSVKREPGSAPPLSAVGRDGNEYYYAGGLLEEFIKVEEAF
jgi:hypothetical protein